MLMMREGRKVSCRRITGVVVSEDKTITYAVVIGVSDHVGSRLGDEELFEVECEPSTKRMLPLAKPAEGGRSS